jgi:hypothetical protein
MVENVAALAHVGLHDDPSGCVITLPKRLPLIDIVSNYLLIFKPLSLLR